MYENPGSDPHQDPDLRAGMCTHLLQPADNVLSRWQNSICGGFGEEILEEKWTILWDDKEISRHWTFSPFHFWRFLFPGQNNQAHTSFSHMLLELCSKSWTWFQSISCPVSELRPLYVFDSPHQAKTLDFWAKFWAFVSLFGAHN